jgi:hypothetical protein
MLRAPGAPSPSCGRPAGRYTAGSAALALEEDTFGWGLDRLLEGLVARRATSARTPR